MYRTTRLILTLFTFKSKFSDGCKAPSAGDRSSSIGFPLLVRRVLLHLKPLARPKFLTVKVNKAPIFCAITTPILLFSCLDASVTESISHPFIVAAYYESWSQFDSKAGGRDPFTPDTIESSLFSDLYYAFSLFGFVTPSIDSKNPRLTGNYRLTPIYPNEHKELYPAFTSLKKKGRAMPRLFLSIGGASFNDPNDPNNIGRYTYKLFSEMVSSKEGRKEFIDSAIKTAKNYGFDGIDIDWEYPGDSKRGGKESDYGNFLKLLSEAKEAFHKENPPLLLSIAVPPLPSPDAGESFKKDPSLYYQWIAKASSLVDRVVLMAYNYHTPFDGEKITGVNAPLMRDSDPSSTLYIDKTVEEFSKNGVHLNKVLLGIATYGWSYGEVSDLSTKSSGPGKPFHQPGNEGPYLKRKGFLSYYEIADMIAKNNLVLKTDLTTTTAYAYNITTKQWVSFDTPETTEKKIFLAKEKKLGGVIFWAVNLDEYQWEPRFPNIRKAAKMAFSNNPRSTFSTSPVSEER